MNDIVSKLTFGFLMAQLVPGAIAVYSVTLVYIASITGDECSVSAVATKALDLWVSSRTSAKIIFVGLSAVVGMTIHGINWSVLGFLENRHRILTPGDKKPKAASQSFWHNYPVGVQMLLGPIKITIEIVMLLGTRLRGLDLRDIAIEENVDKVPETRFAAFQFLQDFYLHFAQFFAHTSYALVFAFFSFIVLLFLSDFSLKIFGLAFVAYMLAGFFFVIGRIQFASLFKAEWSLSHAKQSG